MSAVSATYSGPVRNDWKIPLNIAICLHLAIVLSAFFLPDFFKAKPKYAEIYSVSLVSVNEPAASAPPPPPPAAKSQPVQKQLPVKKIERTEAKQTPPPPEIKESPPPKDAVPIDDIKPKEEPVPPKAISIKPLKKKLVKEVKKDDFQEKEIDRKKIQDLASRIKREQLADMLKQEQQEQQRQDLQRQKQLEREQQLKQQREQLAAALRQQQILEARARLEREAVDEERNLMNQQNYSATSRSSSANSSSSSSSTASSNTGTSKSGPVTSGSSNLIEGQYMAAIINRIQQFWSLPEYLQSDASLMAVTVITINQDGQIANVFFENRSSNPIFDQFVSKALEAANPLPPIPPALNKQRLEVGLRFKPGSIQ